MQTLLLTGGTGFLGSHIIEDLCEKYHIIVLKRSHSDISKIEPFLSKITTYNIDEIDLETVFRDHTIDTIIHTATSYGRTYRYLSDIIESNLSLPMRLVDLGIKYEVGIFLNTDTFWDENIELPIGLKYYALTKKDFLKYTHLAILEKQTMKLFNLKIEHLYGPRDDTKKFLPYVCTSLLQNVESLKLTKGEQKRDFIYVKDAVQAYDLILENAINIKESISDYDIGTGEVFTIREIVEKIKHLVSADTELLFGAIEYRKGEAMEAKADISGLTHLGWKPQFSLDRGLQETLTSISL